MRLVILESPYSSSNGKSVSQNVAYAKLCLLDSLERDEAPIASHLLFTDKGILDDNVPWEREVGMAAGHEWYRRADACVVYTDYGISLGMKDGITAAGKRRCKIEYRQINPKETTDGTGIQFQDADVGVEGGEVGEGPQGLEGWKGTGGARSGVLAEDGHWSAAAPGQGEAQAQAQAA